jgi:Fe-S cluster biogenesis protein NfuA
MPKIAEIDYSPNPNAVKFILKEPVASGFPRVYRDAGAAAADPVAMALFAAGNIESVAMMDRWLTVVKGDGAAWDDLMPLIAPIVREAPPIAAPDPAGGGAGISIGEGARDDPFLQKVLAALEEHIYPFMAADGGGMEVVARNGKQVMIRYAGACQNCPAGMVGTLMAIEGILRAEVDPEIRVATV